MMAGENQAALAVCAQTKVIFPFKVVSVFERKLDAILNIWSTFDGSNEFYIVLVEYFI